MSSSFNRDLRVCASKREVLELTTFRYSDFLLRGVICHLLGGNGTKVKIPCEIKPPLAWVRQNIIPNEKIALGHLCSTWTLDKEILIKRN